MLVLRDLSVLPSPYANCIFESGWIAINHGTILDLGDGAPPPSIAALAANVISLPGTIALPGLVNGHTHSAQAILRGIARGVPLAQWLDILRPFRRAMTAMDVRRAARLAFLENIRSGVTWVVDHHKVVTSPDHVNAVMDAAADVGIGLLLVRGFRTSPSSSSDHESWVQVESEVRQLFRQAQSVASGRLRIGLGPTGLWHASDESIERAGSMCRDLGLTFHLHVAETKEEVSESVATHGLTPIARLARLGALGPRCHLVHCNWISEHEVSLITQAQATVVHCPIANLSLRSGVAPIAAFISRGIPVVVGTDGAASNDSQNLFETTKLACLLPAVLDTERPVLGASQTLAMASTASCLALGITDSLGLVRGAPANITIVRSCPPFGSDVLERIGNLVFACGPADVHTVIVSGEIVLFGGRATRIDEEQVIVEANIAAKDLRTRIDR